MGSQRDFSLRHPPTPAGQVELGRWRAQDEHLVDEEPSYEQRLTERVIRVRANAGAIEELIRSIPKDRMLAARIVLVRLFGAAKAMRLIESVRGGGEWAALWFDGEADARRREELRLQLRPLPTLSFFDARAVGELADAVARLDHLDSGAVVADVLASMPTPVSHAAQYLLSRHSAMDALGMTKSSARRSVRTARGLALVPATNRRAVTLYRRAIEASAEPTDEKHESALDAGLAQRGQGTPLPDDVRLKMEQRFGVRFERVRIHLDGVAAAAARAISARAFTIGDEIFFAAGAFEPGSDEGMKLIAHELTHIVQAYEGRAASTHGISDPGEPLEREAAEVGERIASGLAALPGTPEPKRSHAPSVAATVYRHPNERIEEALKKRDTTDLTVDECQQASEEQKFQLLPVIVASDRYARQSKILVIWKSFGDRLSALVNTHRDLWDASVTMCDALATLPAVKKVQEELKKDILQIASDNLFKNRQFVIDRKKALGLDGTADPLTPEEKAKLRQNIQSMAYRVWELKQAQKRLRDTTVGAIPLAFAGFDPEKFNPDQLPRHPLAVWGRQGPKWDQLKCAWDVIAGEIARIGASYPEIYSAQQNEEQLLHLARVIPEHFDDDVRQRLDELTLKIEDVQRQLDGGDIDAFDLRPIQQQLLQGVGGSHEWNEGFHHWAAQTLLDDHAAQQAAIKKVLAGVEVIALVVTTFATAGSMTFFVAGAIAVVTPGVQAAVDWNQAKKLDAAANVTPLQGTALVMQSQADEKRSQAVMNAISAFLNALGGAASLAEATNLLKVESTLQKVGGPAAGELAARLGCSSEQLAKAAQAVELRQAGKLEEAEKLLAELESEVGPAKAQRIEAEFGDIAKGGCFLAGTMVYLLGGPRAIETVGIGDAVFCFDVERQRDAVGTIAQLFVRRVGEIVDISVCGTTVSCSPEHPFWVDGAGWREAGALAAGDTLFSRERGPVRIDRTTQRRGIFTVFNIEVGGEHNYFVSDLGLLVHNKAAILDPLKEVQALRDQYQPVLKRRPDLGAQLDALEKRAFDAISKGDQSEMLAVNQDLRDLGELLESDLKAKPFFNSRGELTNGTYTIDGPGMAPHKTGSLGGGKSQWLSGVDAEKATLDAAAKADAQGLWSGSKAKVQADTDVGVLGSTGEKTRWINVYRTKTGFVHGSPGTPP